MQSTPSTLDQLRRATKLAEEIERLQSELTSLLSQDAQPQSVSNSRPAASADGAGAAKQAGGKRGAKRTVSPEGRARMAAGQQARWAKAHGGKSSRTADASQASGGPKSDVRKSGKRTVSPEARAKIAAAQRARWAKQKKS